MNFEAGNHFGTIDHPPQPQPNLKVSRIENDKENNAGSNPLSKTGYFGV